MPGPPPLTVKINNRDVTFHDHRVTGRTVKETAIAQGVEIALDFQLSMRQSAGSLHVVGDDDTVTLTKNTVFRAVGPDDNS